MESQIIQALEQGKIVLLTGLRGTGKTTILRSLEKKLKDCTFQDLEDPRLAPRPRKETLEVFSGASRYVLLDEVGRVDGWLDWARRQEGGVAASLSGPRINLSEKDVVQFTLYPYRLTDTSVDLLGYLKAGGFPAARTRDDLIRLFNLCLFKDVVQRYEVRDIDKLTAIAVYLISSSSRPVSASRLKGLISRSVDQARGFMAHLERSGLVHLVPRIEDGTRDRPQAARRCFSADCGLSVALAHREPDLRDLAETAVFHELLRQGLTVQAWRARGRLGLAVVGRDRPRLMIDVAWRDRNPVGIQPLGSAMAMHSCEEGLLLGEEDGAQGSIVMQNLRKWLESPDLPGISSPGRKVKGGSSLPAYLL